MGNWVQTKNQIIKWRGWRDGLGLVCEGNWRADEVGHYLKNFILRKKYNTLKNIYISISRKTEQCVGSLNALFISYSNTVSASYTVSVKYNNVYVGTNLMFGDGVFHSDSHYAAQ